MGVLTRYIVVEVVKGSTIALLLLLTLFNLFTFSDQLQDIGKGSYDLKKVIFYLALTSPRVVYELMPSAALLGSLFVVGSMANNREIIAMRAMGVSVMGIIRTIMLAGLVLVVISIGIGEFVAPETERTAQIMRQMAMNDSSLLKSKYGMWLREGNRFVNVRQILDDGSLQDLRVYEVNAQRQLSNFMHADKAQFQGDKKWLLENVQQSRLDSKSVASEAFSSLTWVSDIESDLLKVTVVDSENLAMYDLFNYIDFLKANHQKSQSYELAFWGRVINPFVTFVMLLVSAPFVISIGRTSSTGARIMTGVLIGTVFNITDKLTSHIGVVYELNPLLMAILPTLIVFSVALIALRRIS